MSSNDVMQLIVVVATAIGGLTIVSAIARRIAGPYSKRSLANQIAVGHLGRPDDAALAELRDEVAQLRSEVAELQGRAVELDEVQSRLDFAERTSTASSRPNGSP